MAQSNLILEKYLQALEKDPSSRVFAPLAEYYRKNGLLNQAIDTLSTGIKYNPDYILGHLGLAFCYYDNGDVKRAYDILNPLVDANRDNIRMLKLFSDICLDLKKNDQALENLKYLLFINPKDSEAAEKVTLLEKENEKFGPIKFNIQDEISDHPSEILFDVDSMSSVPEKVSEVEEWVKVDLQSHEKEEESFDNWSMDQEVEIPEVSTTEEEVREFKVEKSSEKMETPKSGDTPVITHTLVDLYCNQGYLDKAKDLLEKILELNPNDLKTKLKLQEVERVLSEAYLDDLGKEHEDVEQEIKEVKEEKKFTEESDRNQLMNLFDKTVEPEKVAPSKLSVVPNVENKEVNSSVTEIESKLWKFHKQLVTRANEILER